jgi:integrase
MQSRQGVMHFRIKGKRDKGPLHPGASDGATAHRGIPCGGETRRGAGWWRRSGGPLFRPVKNNSTGTLEKHLNPASVYRNIVQKYGRETGVNAEMNCLCVHSMRATAATTAFSNEADIAKVQEWLGHANVSTTGLYDRRKTRPEDSPTFHVKY